MYNNTTSSKKTSKDKNLFLFGLTFLVGILNGAAFMAYLN